MTRGRLAFLAISTGFTVVIAGTGLATAQTQEPIYGGQLMTQQEIRDYQEKMRSASSDEQRQQIRREHRREMQERAKRKGVVLHAGVAHGGGFWRRQRRRPMRLLRQFARASS